MRCTFVLCVLACAPASAQQTILDQIGVNGANLRDAGGFISGYFNHYSTPPVSFGNRAMLDDFGLTQPTRLTRIEAAVAASPGSPIVWSNLLGWRVEVYSNPQVALNNDLTGDLLHATFQAPASLINPYIPFLYGGNPIVLASFDIDLTLNPGMYWVAVLPVNTASNGYGVTIGTTVGNQFNPWQVLPGVTVLPINQPGMAFRIFGSPPSCYGNCDSSTIAPVLNINDFVCFQTRYAAGDSYANCDQSTTPPVLNVADFICFLNAYAAGCGR